MNFKVSDGLAFVSSLAFGGAVGKLTLACGGSNKEAAEVAGLGAIFVTAGYVALALTVREAAEKFARKNDAEEKPEVDNTSSEPSELSNE